MCVKCVLSVNTSIDSAGCALSKVLWLQLDLVSSWAENDRKLVGVSKDGAGAARKFAVTFAVQRLVWSSWNQKSKRSPFQELLIGTSFVNTKVLIIAKVFGSLNNFLKRKLKFLVKINFVLLDTKSASIRDVEVTWLDLYFTYLFICKLFSSPAAIDWKTVYSGRKKGRKAELGPGLVTYVTADGIRFDCCNRNVSGQHLTL